MRLARLLLALVVIAPLGIGALSQPVAAADDAGSFIATAGNEVLRLARDRSLSQSEFKQRLHAIAAKDFDTPRIAQFVLGRYWRSASEGDRQQFVRAFEDYMVQVYASRFREYSGASFKVVSDRQEGNTSVVTTVIDRGNGQPPAKVTWQVTKTPEGYKISDVSIEGISQALTYRQEFGSVIEQHGGQVSALTEQLRQKASG
jgi:phospholipid transport system substrate-binding protein